ncbi:NAD-dependent epimerase/dehydratase family protein [Alphaproteobacteria bacterium]|nr:NAD-dependent epimerase/dehydratase family protein [Alphaproteobacteria bacterium]
MKSKNILVTGGNGFIGSALVDRLIGFGHNVFVIDDLSTGLKENSNAEAKYTFYDLVKCLEYPAYLESYLLSNEIEVVYHLAASADVQMSVDSPEKTYLINLLASIAIYNLCVKTHVRKFVFASTSAIFGPPKYLPVDEFHPAEPISPYGLTKLNFEQFLGYQNGSSKLNHTVFRFPNVYGPRQREDLEGGVIAIFKGLALKGCDFDVYGDGCQTRDWVYVDDIVNALCCVLEIDFQCEVYNLGSGEQIALNEFINILKKFGFFTGNVNYFAERKGDIKHMALSSDKAKRMLNWEPCIGFKEGIRKVWSEV